MKSDITSRRDIETLVKLFYDKLLQDVAVKNIFEETVLQHLESHLKTIADFWDSILLDADNYRGNVLNIGCCIGMHLLMNYLVVKEQQWQKPERNL